jgi:hypothetical protein
MSKYFGPLVSTASTISTSFWTKASLRGPAESARWNGGMCCGPPASSSPYRVACMSCPVMYTDRARHRLAPQDTASSIRQNIGLLPCIAEYESPTPLHGNPTPVHCQVPLNVGCRTYIRVRICISYTPIYSTNPSAICLPFPYPYLQPTPLSDQTHPYRSAGAKREPYLLIYPTCAILTAKVHVHAYKLRSYMDTYSMMGTSSLQPRLETLNLDFAVEEDLRCRPLSTLGACVRNTVTLTDIT